MGFHVSTVDRQDCGLPASKGAGAAKFLPKDGGPQMPRVPRRIIGVAVLALVGMSFAMGNPVKAAPSATMRCPLPQELLVACLQQNFDQSVHEERFNAETAGFT